jgi:hypothetical protein
MRACRFTRVPPWNPGCTARSICFGPGEHVNKNLRLLANVARNFGLFPWRVLSPADASTFVYLAGTVPLKRVNFMNSRLEAKNIIYEATVAAMAAKCETLVITIGDKCTRYKPSVPLALSEQFVC